MRDSRQGGKITDAFAIPITHDVMTCIVALEHLLPRSPPNICILSRIGGNRSCLIKEAPGNMMACRSKLGMAVLMKRTRTALNVYNSTRMG